MFTALNNSEINHSFKKSILNGLSPDGSLYFPKKINHLKELINNITEVSNQEIGFSVMKSFINNEIQNKSLKKIIEKTINFNFPLKKIDHNIFSFELFHGPTLAFKDVGATFLANSLEYFTKNNVLNILVATSGDTGAAVANSFHNKKNINVVILFPKNKISSFQQKQITTKGDNVYGVQVEGDFDQCQKLVKEAFNDKKLRNEIDISSANSINVGRWLPQIIYYFILFKELKKINKEKNICISIPSGNFGNICAGIMSQEMGLNFNKIVGSTNINDTIPRYLLNGLLEPNKTKRTISNAMDVSIPNNFPRIEKIYKNDFKILSKKLIGEKVSELETKNEIKNTFKKSEYVLDPHGAVGLVGLRKNLNKNQTGVFFETAHPIKFIESITDIIGIKEDFFNISTNFNSNETIHSIDNNYTSLIKFLKSIN
jgi:threonine synthase|tara:strand:+ start:9874 stop:11160 length:1287 start_codon:yes stop_codon:yes gene_type:complete